MFNLIADAIEFIHETGSPRYSETKLQARLMCRQAEMASTAVLITSFVVTLLGITAGSYVSPIIFIFIPLCYFAYNSCRVFANLQDIIKNPKHYVNFSKPDEYRPQKLKEKLLKETFCFYWAIDYSVDQILLQMRRDKFQEI